MERMLRPYQQTAVQHIHAHNRVGLFLDMGLGKTAITLASLRPEDLPALVIAPKRVTEATWPEEVKLWRPDLALGLAAGTPKQRLSALAEPLWDVVALGRDNVTRDLPTLLQRQKTEDRFVTLILDESSSYKDYGSKRTKAVLKLSAQVERVIELTGTPNPNGYEDLWSQLKILDGGQRLGKTISAYRDRYFIPAYPLPNGVIPGYALKPGADRRILELIGDICLSMDTDGRVELPPVTYNQISVPLSKDTRKLYDTMEKDFVASLQGELFTAQDAAVKSGKLQQITAGAIHRDDAEFLDPGEDKIVQLHTAKFQAAQEVIEGTGSPILVFYKYQFEKDMLMKLPGAHSIDEPNIVSRWNQGKVPLLVVHPQSAGHGLNLQHGGHTILWTTPTWSLEEWQQGNKRIARSGQTHPVVIHTLISPRTIDVAVMARLEENKTVQQGLLDYLQSPI